MSDPIAPAADPIVIVGAARTPMGAFQGDFSSLAAHDLGGAAIKAAVQRAGIDPALVNEVLFGNCLMAGQGQAPARQAAFKGGLPQSRARSRCPRCAAAA
jgi:acetyl-CoA C-acetyltransferase